uniref:Uncharacterized protein n=1 Tax=Abalone asfa-like virus TaxID=2839893 RepID=A0A5K7XX67_9VIRU|nr:hypothetical protein [Abalone asfa-like virus]BCY04575.1 hypothetical protein [Abalone asfa-like virus]
MSNISASQQAGIKTKEKPITRDSYTLVRGTGTQIPHAAEKSSSSSVNWNKIKCGMFLFILFIIITSDLAEQTLLSHVSGALENRRVTPYGSILQAILLVSIFGVVAYLINQDII